MEEYVHRGQLSFYVEPSQIREIAVALKNEPSLTFEYLADICAVDHLNNPRGAAGRFEVVYNFVSMIHSFRLLLRMRISESSKVPSLCADWHAANWLEREVYDLMGIEFDGNPDMKGAFLKPPDLEGQFPHRKDFGITYEIPQFSHNKDAPIVVVPENPNH